MKVVSLLTIVWQLIIMAIECTPQVIERLNSQSDGGEQDNDGGEEEGCDHNNYFNSKPNIIMIVSDDTGYGDLGVYGGGEGRGMATPNLDELAREGMQFWSFYGQPSCTPGRAAMQTGRLPNRNGMSAVSFPGQGGGLAAEEWTIASILKPQGYQTYFSGKWHLGEDESAMPTSHGYDIMDNVLLYHLNAYTYSFESFNPEITLAQQERLRSTTKGLIRGEVGEESYEFANITQQNISDLDVVMTDDVIDQLNKYVYSAENQPFFMSINFAKNHQPNLPSQGTFGKTNKNFSGSSSVATAYGDSVVELDDNIGRIMAEIKRLGIDENTLIIYTVDNGAWQDVYPDSGYTPFRGSKGTVAEGGSRVPAIMRWPNKIRAGSHSHNIVGGLDLLATFASLAGISELPQYDRAQPEPQPIIFDSIDMSNILFECGSAKREVWYYFTESELSPGALRLNRYKAVWNLRGDIGGTAGNDAAGHELGWRGAQSYVATVPKLYDLYQDPEEKYDMFMNSFSEKTWMMIFMYEQVGILMDTYKQYPIREKQGGAYTGPITLDMFNIYDKINSFSAGSFGGAKLMSSKLIGAKLFGAM